MSGENRVDVGSVTQSTLKGEALESTLARVQNEEGIQMDEKKKKKGE